LAQRRASQIPGVAALRAPHVPRSASQRSMAASPCEPAAATVRERCDPPGAPVLAPASSPWDVPLLELETGLPITPRACADNLSSCSTSSSQGMADDGAQLWVHPSETEWKQDVYNRLEVLGFCEDLRAVVSGSTCNSAARPCSSASVGSSVLGLSPMLLMALAAVAADSRG